MICPKCSTELTNDAIFCHRCGESLNASSDRPRAEIPPEGGRPDTDRPVSPRERFRPAGERAFTEDEEEVEIWRGGYSPKAMVSAWIAAGLLSLIGIIGTLVVAGQFLWIAIAVIVACWVLLALRLVYLRLSFNYLLTTQRLIHESGILYRRTDRIEVIDIDDVAFEQNIVDRFVGVGNIKLASSDRSHDWLMLRGIDKAKEVAGKIDAARRNERIRRGLHIEAV